MATFKIITRKDCPFCQKLKAWLADNNVTYTEIDYLDPSIKKLTEDDDSFTARFCDMSACVDSTPIIIKDNEYYYGEIWDFQTGEIREEKAKKIFEIA
ncbi:MAG: glutaredoxin domain-containing protein [Candidatus Helarchaeota archaeon]